MKNLLGKKLYRLNQAGIPTFWSIIMVNGKYFTHSGQLGGNSSPKAIATTEEQVTKRYKDKLNDGYVLYDETTMSESDFIKTLSGDRTTAEGFMKPMKAQPYKPDSLQFPLFVQGKINGNRCTPVWVNYPPKDLFDTGYEGFVFRSMGGEEYRIDHLAKILNDAAIINPAIKNLSFDGELFIANAKVATISGAARNPDNFMHKELSFISFDLMNDEKQGSRFGELYVTCKKIFPMLDLDMDINTIIPNVYILTSIMIDEEEKVIPLRDIAIKNNFEGIILRDPRAYYGFGKRVKTMRKLKKETYGEFLVIDIKPRNNSDKLPIFVLMNDITGDEFEASCNGTHQEQYLALKNKKDYKFKFITVRYYERTINNLPLHATVFLVDK